MKSAICIIYLLFYISLNKKGKFWLDFLNAEYVTENYVKENFIKLNKNIEVFVTREIKNKRIIKKIKFIKKGKEKNYIESIKLYTKDELANIFSKTGFEILNIFGNYEGEAWSKDLKRTIIHGEKK